VAAAATGRLSGRTHVGGAARRLGALLLAGLTALLGGCGFHLRGSDALPEAMRVTFISSFAPYSTLVDDFATALEAHGAKVTKQRDAATAVLRILEDKTDTRVLSVNTQGKVLEYDIRQTIRFKVETPAKAVLVPEQTVSMNRDYLYSSTDVLGKQRESKVVRASLQRNIVNLAMLRITAADR